MEWDKPESSDVKRVGNEESVVVANCRIGLWRKLLALSLGID